LKGGEEMSTKERAAVIVACIVAISAVIAIVVLQEPTETSNTPPIAPAEVLSVWKSPPSPQSYPPILLGEVTLAEYGMEHSTSNTELFFLQNGQWIDVIVKSEDELVMFLRREPGYASFGVAFQYSGGGYSPDLEDLESFGVNPFLGRMLYEQRTETDTGIVYTTAVRLFAEGGYENGNWLGCECALGFENFNPNESVSISYEIYELAVTPGWGAHLDVTYRNTVLVPWIRQHASSESESEQMYKRWLEQFKLTS
jgi:hypothetical protein